MQISSMSGGFGAMRAVPTKEQREQQFLKADTDGSGGLSIEEFEQGAPADALAKLASSGPSAENLFKRMDRDGNGELTQGEIENGKPKFDSANMSVLIQLQSAGDTETDQSLAKLLAEDEDEQDDDKDVTKSESTLVERLQDIQSLLMDYLSRTSANFTLRTDGTRSSVE